MMTRRRLLALLAAGAGAAVAAPILRRRLGARGRRATVRVLPVPSYAALTAALLAAAVPAAHLALIRGRTVLLKPNLVEYRPGQPINTDPRFVAALIEAFASLGAADVIVGEGPGHRRDTDYLLAASGLGEVVRRAGVRFVDLNLDTNGAQPIPGGGVSGLRRLHLPRTVTDAAYVVSVPKMKTHHLVGVTLSLKNLFGVVPGTAYGWPKNLLHWHGIERAIVDIAATVQPDLAVVDGIVGMDGDGPLWGRPVGAGVVVVGDALASVDATCCRLMGFRPEAVPYLVAAAETHGAIAAGRIEVAGPPLASLVRPFTPAVDFSGLREPA
jgi:uncharacterized protein (DUF362 family)